MLCNKTQTVEATIFSIFYSFKTVSLQSAFDTESSHAESQP